MKDANTHSAEEYNPQEYVKSNVHTFVEVRTLRSSQALMKSAHSGPTL